MPDCRRYKALENDSSKKPPSTNLVWEMTNGDLMLVDSTSLTDLLISDDKGASWNSVDTGEFNNGVITRGQNIQMAWHDEDGDKIWFVDCDNDGADEVFTVWYLTISTYALTEVDDLDMSDPIKVYDIYKRDSKIEVFFVEDRGGGNYWLSWYDVDQSPFTETYVTLRLSDYVASPGIVIGTNYYHAWDIGGALYYMRFTGATIDQWDDINAYSFPALSQRGSAYDGSDNIYFVGNKDGDGLNYLLRYNITGNSITALSVYNIALQLDRNNRATIPNELEKAFGISNEIVYEIKPRRGGIIQLQDLNGSAGGNIIAITDNFLMRTGGEMFEWTNVAIQMSNLSYTGGIIPIPKLGSFQVHSTLAIRWSEKDSFKYYDDSDVLEIWAKITEEYVDLFNNYHYDFDFFSNEMYRPTYVKAYTTDESDAKQKDIIDNKFNFNYRSSSIVGTTTTYSYDYKRTTSYMFDLARFLERQIPYIEPDGKVWTKAHDGLAKNAQHYPGTYSFKEEVDGTADTAIDLIDGKTGTDTGTSATIIAEEDTHKKVIKFIANGDNGAFIRWEHVLDSDQTIGTLELLMKYIDKGVGNYRFDLYDASAFLLCYIQFNSSDNKLYVFHGNGAGGTTSTSIVAAADTWHHIKFEFDNTADTFSVILNTVYIITDETYRNDHDGDDFHEYRFLLLDGAGANSLEGYVDAIGESWDPSYNVGDNVVAWTLNDGNQNVQMIDIPRLALDRGGYFSGSLGVTRAIVRYKDNATSIKPTIPASGKTATELLTGIIELKEFRDAKVEDSPEADQLATNLYNIYTSTIQFIGLRVEGEGFLQEGKTVYLENTGQITITAGHFVILRYRRWPLQDVTNMVVSDNIIFPREFTSFGDTTRLQVHGANLQSFENQEQLSKHGQLVWRTPEPTAYDYDKAALAAIGDVAGTWYDLDLSAIVPEDASAVLIKILGIDNATTSEFHFRKNGQVNVFQICGIFTCMANMREEDQLEVGVDVNRKIEFRADPKSSDWASIDLVVLGWYI